MRGKLRVAVNTRLLIANKLDGIGYFAHEILQRMVAHNPEVEFYFLFDRPYDPQFIYGKNVTAVVLPPQARHPILYFLWFHISIKNWLKKHNPDVFFSPEGYLTPNFSNQINVIHDLNFEHHPENLPLAERIYYRHFFPKYARWAKYIFTVSDFVKQDIQQQYRISEKKIGVSLNGIRENFKVTRSTSAFKESFTSGCNFLLHVGTLHPRKNIEEIIAVFNSIKHTNKPDLKLVLVGRKKWWTSDMEAAFQSSPWKADIVFTDRITTEELALAYNEAELLLLLSKHEGFGLPIVEAMACGCPVVLENNSALGEVAGNAAVVLNPDLKTNDRASRIIEILNSSEKREALRNAGLKHAENFSWDKSAQLIMQKLKSIAQTD